MSKKEKWSIFGKNTGNAFKNFGKAMATTAKVVFGDEENTVNEEGQSKLKEAWSKTGKGFGEAGKALGDATVETFEGDNNQKKETKQDDVIDVEVVDGQKNDQQD